MSEATAKMRRLAEGFALSGVFEEGAEIESGHINATYAVRCGGRRYVIQRINDFVFPEPEKVMANIALVTSHLASVEMGGMEPLRLVQAKSGENFLRQDGYWRCYHFVEEAVAHDRVETEELAEEAAYGYACFQNQLQELEVESLYETIPGFHETPRRYRALVEAFEGADEPLRVEVEEEMTFLEERKAEYGTLHEAGLPLVVTHNDTKANNIMLDHRSGRAKCVIDLDTVMPGIGLHDFGDLVRSVTPAGAEDDVDGAEMRMCLYEALVRGWVRGKGSSLMQKERELMPVAGKLITLETGMRFLTDHLEGDRYFKVKERGHNLQRARSQFQLARSMERQLGV